LDIRKRNLNNRLLYYREKNMNKLHYFLILFLGLLLILAAILVVFIRQYKRQLSLFTAALTEHLDSSLNSPITVEYFRKDIVNLANALNLYIDKLKSQSVELKKERLTLKNVIAGISHDFRTPLTAAKGYLQLIEKNGQLSAADRENLYIVRDKIQYLQALSEIFFEISVLQANTEPIEFENINLRNLLWNTIMEQYQWTVQKNISTEFNIPKEDIFISSSLTLLERILENIFSNARKYTLSRLTINLFKRDGLIQLSVANDITDYSGVDVNRIFEPFYRNKSRNSNGTGLGLYVVKCLGDKLGYKINAGIENDIFSIDLFIPEK